MMIWGSIPRNSAKDLLGVVLLLLDKILHDLKDSKLCELWYIPYNGYCRILSINSIIEFKHAELCEFW